MKKTIRIMVMILAAAAGAIASASAMSAYARDDFVLSIVMVFITAVCATVAVAAARPFFQ